MSEADPRGVRTQRAVMRAIPVLLGLLIVGGLLLLGLRLLEPPADDYVGAGSGEVTISVSPGQTLSQIGSTLVTADVVRSQAAFIRATEADPRAAGIAAGTYLMRRQMSAAAAIERFLDPATRIVDRVVIPEGSTASDVVSRVADATGLSTESLQAVLDNPQALGLPAYAGQNVEGFLFPATYELDPAATADAVLGRMVRRFETAAADVDLVARAKARGITPYEAVIIASLVEREGRPEDFGKVAQVVYNRLAAGMPLQFDSTVNYGLGINELNLTRDQLDTDTPYNSYRNRGLPPTPISNPGAAALRAALFPEDGDWLYFVTVDPDTGETRFSVDYDDFLVNKRLLDAWRRDNPGR
ncbi:MAG: endolytic transglycosylase MltG [Actinomycetales bacterium]|nr:endolytic transglycosylase MltG [Actinomycetales bacterium]